LQSWLRLAKRVSNRIPDAVRQRVVAMALEVPELSPREPAKRFTNTESYFVSEYSVYRLLKGVLSGYAAACAHSRFWHTFPVLGGGRVRQLTGVHLPCAHRCQTGEI
jgi:hypothetical protein